MTGVEFVSSLSSSFNVFKGFNKIVPLIITMLGYFSAKHANGCCEKLPTGNLAAISKNISSCSVLPLLSFSHSYLVFFSELFLKIQPG